MAVRLEAGAVAVAIKAMVVVLVVQAATEPEAKLESFHGR